MIASLIATRVIIHLDSETVKLIIAICMPLVVVLMFLKRKISAKTETRHDINLKTVLLCMLSGFIVGAYDGLFGPGGGTIAMIIFSVFLNYDLRVGCGNGKIIVIVSNITALINYIIGGYMIYHVAIPCTIANMIGSYAGAALAVKKGEKIVFPTMLVVVAVLVVQTIVNVIINN